MSFAGLRVFEQNLRKLTESKEFRKALKEKSGKELGMGYKLTNSKYGKGTIIKKKDK